MELLMELASIRPVDCDESTSDEDEVLDHVALELATADAVVLFLFALALLEGLSVPSPTDGVHHSMIGRIHWSD